MKTWMIYGANGYTGKLIAEKAAGEGKRPILAGRRRETIEPLAKGLGLSWRTFDLATVDQAAQGLHGIDVVLNCAGPFSKTYPVMIAACLKQKVSYLDITGEIEIFESAQALQQEIKKAEILCIPGVGFDVVPTDCLARLLASKLPDATHLEFAFAAGGGISPGTMKTMVENISEGGRIRREGKIIKVSANHVSKKISFSNRSLWATSIPWGDVSTAYYSTGIPNITVYAAIPKTAARVMQVIRAFGPILSLQTVQNFLKRQIEKRVKGPSEEVLSTAKTYLWGRVSDPSGGSVEATLDVPEGYSFTVTSALACMERVLKGDVPWGVWTPSVAFGADLVTALPRTTLTMRTS